MSTIIVLMGAPGAGKGTQARLAAQRFGWPRISTGDILRQIADRDTDLGRQVRGVLASGQLVADDILAEIIHDRTQQEDCRNGYILDGFPRNIYQAQFLAELAGARNHQILVLNLSVGRETLITRVGGRRVLESRSDDTPEAVRKRLEVYDEKTAPVIEYYRERGMLFDVNGEQSVETVSKDILEIIKRETNHDSVTEQGRD